MSEIQLKDINKAAVNDPAGFILDCERKYTSKLLGLTEHLESSGARIILLAGPSSSGKTTTANLLCDMLSERGHRTVVVSMDNFYRDMTDPLYPKDDEGRLDYESVNALRTERIHDCISLLLNGGEALIPKFVFGKGKSVNDGERVSLPKGGFVIMEGLHALNPLICKGLEGKDILKLFISVSTNINDGDKRVLSGRKIRFVRRMTRDFLYRKTDAAGTLARWESVIGGENRNLYPYKDTADICFDTFHEFELGIMKPFAERIIEHSSAALGGEYIDCVKNAISRFNEINIEYLPVTSLIREFVPGGKYEDLY